MNASASLDLTSIPERIQSEVKRAIQRFAELSAELRCLDFDWRRQSAGLFTIDQALREFLGNAGAVVTRTEFGSAG